MIGKKFFREIYARLFTERYLIYKASGGLFHNLTTLSRAIQLAKRQNRKLIIDMKQHRAFKLDFSTFFTLQMEYYEDYSILEKYDSQEIKRIREAKASEFKGLEIKLEKEVLVYVSPGGGTIDKRVKVNNQIMENLKKEAQIEEPYITVHFRNTDRKNEIAPFIKQIKKVRNEENIHVLYLASDDFFAYEKMKEHLDDMRIIRKVIPIKGVKNIHYHTDDKYQQIYESLLDVYFILQSDFFIPSYNSGYSRGIIKMIKHNNYIFPNFSSQTKVVAENA